MSIRTMSVAGSFYPADFHEINTMIEHFNTILASHPQLLDRFDTLRGQAVIVPHAGWIYSGFTANIAYRSLKNSIPKTIVVIGPSHRIGFNGVSIADVEFYQTPLGELPIDQKLVKDLKNLFAIPYYSDAHHEHSTEVQMPFIKYYMPDVKVVELVYAYAQPSILEPLIRHSLNDPNTAVVISTDLSHYYSLKEAKKLDSICLEAILNENIKQLHQGCEACGRIGVESMLSVAKEQEMKAVLLDYRTSADASKDTNRVVGYVSVLFTDQAVS